MLTMFIENYSEALRWRAYAATTLGKLKIDDNPVALAHVQEYQFTEAVSIASKLCGVLDLIPELRETTSGVDKGSMHEKMKKIVQQAMDLSLHVGKEASELHIVGIESFIDGIFDLKDERYKGRLGEEDWDEEEQQNLCPVLIMNPGFLKVNAQPTYQESIWISAKLDLVNFQSSENI